MPTGDSGAVKARDFAGASAKDAIKTKSLYDLSGRLEYFHVAQIHAENGDPCFSTQYTYVGITGSVDKSKEYVGAWLSTWDI